MNLMNVFDQLLHSEQFVDVTLACEGSLIKAHKMVLSACSPYFQAIFADNPCQHPVVIMKDIRLNELKAIVEFMYKGEINVVQDQIGPLLRVAETLKIRGLADVSEQQNKMTGHVENTVSGIDAPLKPVAVVENVRTEELPANSDVETAAFMETPVKSIKKLGRNTSKRRTSAVSEVEADTAKPMLNNSDTQPKKMKTASMDNEIAVPQVKEIKAQAIKKSKNAKKIEKATNAEDLVEDIKEETSMSEISLGDEEHKVNIFFFIYFIFMVRIKIQVNQPFLKKSFGKVWCSSSKVTKKFKLE